MRNIDMGKVLADIILGIVAVGSFAGMLATLTVIAAYMGAI